MPPGFSGVTQIPNFEWQWARITAGSSATLGLTGPASGTYEIIGIFMTEMTANARTVTIRLVPSGATPGVTHNLYTSQAVGSNATVALTNSGQPIAIMNAGETLTFTASAADSVNCMVLYKVWR